MTLSDIQEHELACLAKEIGELQETARVIGLRIHSLIRDDKEIESLTTEEIQALSDTKLILKRRGYVTARTRVGVFKELQKRGLPR
jgi:hypothetical protein